jgi:hypothetical protein
VGGVISFDLTGRKYGSDGTPSSGEPGGNDDVLVSATTATPTQSRTSVSASLGTMKDARKIGKNLFPVHRNCRVWRPGSTGVSIVSFISTDPTR